MKTFEISNLEVSPLRSSATGLKGVGVYPYPNAPYRSFVQVPEDYRSHLKRNPNQNLVLVLNKGDNPAELGWIRQKFLEEVSERGWEEMIEEVEFFEAKWFPSTLPPQFI
jgi:hypothetical protein